MFTLTFGLLGAGPFVLYGQEIAYGDLAIIGLLVLLEGVLSIDNALVLGLLAKRLPPHQRARALSYGLIGAFVFRVIAIATASFLLQWTFVKFLGGFYLVFIAVKHLFFESHEEEEHKIVMDKEGNPSLVDAQTGSDLTSNQQDIEIRERVPVGVSLINEESNETTTPANTTPPTPSSAATSTANTIKTLAKTPSFWGTVLVIELTDIAFAVDSILAAMALAGSRQSKLWVVIAGGILGVVLMRFAAALFVRLLDRFPRFEVSAYLLVIIIGVKLLADWGFNSDWSYQQSPWIASRLGSWSETFKNIESTRRESVTNYEAWLTANWPLTKGAKLGHAAHAGDDHAHDEHATSEHKDTSHTGSSDADSPATDTTAKKKEVSIPHIPHLLDFHDLRRPECLGFWVAMAVCFGIGFVPRSRTKLDT
jgi:predicted tellurium resistance membrane protein TerC